MKAYHPGVGVSSSSEGSASSFVCTRPSDHGCIEMRDKIRLPLWKCYLIPLYKHSKKKKIERERERGREGDLSSSFSPQLHLEKDWNSSLSFKRSSRSTVVPIIPLCSHQWSLPLFFFIFFFHFFSPLLLLWAPRHEKLAFIAVAFMRWVVLFCWQWRL